MARQVLGRLAATATPWSAFGQSDAFSPWPALAMCLPSLGSELAIGAWAFICSCPALVEESCEFPQWHAQSPFGADVAC